MRIPDVRSPDLFQRLVHRLYIAEYGHGLQVVDDSAGDRGNDGYDPERELLLAVYCPEKDPTEAKALAKGRGDLAKAARLTAAPGYRFRTWVFVTPAPLPEKVQAALRAEAALAGLTAQFLSGVHLEDIYLRHAELRPVFPELDYPRVDRELAAIRAKLDAPAATPPGEVREVFLRRPSGRPMSQSAPACPGPTFWLCGLVVCIAEVSAGHALYADSASGFLRAANSVPWTALDGRATFGLALVSLLGLQQVLTAVLGGACLKHLWRHL